MDNKYPLISKDLFPSELMDKLKSIDFPVPQLNYSNLVPHFEMPTLLEMQTDFEVPALSMIEPIPIREHIERTEQYQRDSIKILESIQQNTANLYTLVDLINKNNEQQDELIGLISEIMTISKAKNKEEADSLFRNVLANANKIITDGETLFKIVSYATSVYGAVNTMLQSI